MQACPLPAPEHRRVLAKDKPGGVHLLENQGLLLLLLLNGRRRGSGSAGVYRSRPSARRHRRGGAAALCCSCRKHASQLEIPE